MMGTIHHIHRKPRLVEPPRDYAERARIMAEENALAEERADRLLAIIADCERDRRVMRWQSRIAIACYVLVVATACWFAFQLGRGAF